MDFLHVYSTILVNLDFISFLTMPLPLGWLTGVIRTSWPLYVKNWLTDLGSWYFTLSNFRCSRVCLVCYEMLNGAIQDECGVVLPYWSSAIITADHWKLTKSYPVWQKMDDILPCYNQSALHLLGKYPHTGICVAITLCWKPYELLCRGQ